MNINKSKIKYGGFFILAFCIITVILIYYFRVQLVKHFIPIIKQTGEINIQIKNDTSTIRSKLVVTNKSFLKIKIDSIKYKVSLHQKTYLESDKVIGVLLSGHGIDTLDFSLKIPYKTILEDLKDVRKNLDSTTYSIHVSLVYSTIFGRIEIPFEKTSRLKIPKPPQISLEGVSYQKIRFKYILAEAKIKIVNHSSLNLSVKKIDYTIIILNQGNLKGSLGDPINIAPKSTSFVYLPIEIGMENIGSTIFKVIMNKDKFIYTLDLNAFLEVKNPLQEAFHIHVTSNGIMELVK